MLKKENKNGFTLVELLAVIVILAIILVIAVPKVMSVIEDSKKATLESTAKMIASSAEKQKVQNTVLGNTKEITCDSVAKINKGDYASCSIEFENNTAKVTIEGSGKFDGLYVCGGTKIEATTQRDGCQEPIEVKHALFLKGQELTPDKFEVTLTNSDGNTRVLENGKGYVIDGSVDGEIITSPNWPENYLNNMTEEENYWIYTHEGASAIQITFDATSETGHIYDRINIYDKDGKIVYQLCKDTFGGKSFIVNGDYVKITMKSISYSQPGKGFSAIIKPLNNVPAEYTVSPAVVPNVEGNFDITITVNGENISKKITTTTVHDVDDYVTSLEPFASDVVQTTAEYNGTTYDAGIRYVGKMDEVKNKVYYNCESTDVSGVSYGAETYNYASSCEVWRIIGVFDTKTSTNGIPEKRIKLVNLDSTFDAGWDSSDIDVNYGYGINQWGESVYSDGTTYEGADLMRLLNGYYIGKEGATCRVCTDEGQETCEQECTTEELTSANMKPLTAKAKSMIGNAVWDTYAVKRPYSEPDASWAPTAYLEEKGISAQYKSNTYDNDTVNRTFNWTGLVGLVSVSDIAYSNVWIGLSNITAITPYFDSGNYIWEAYEEVIESLDCSAFNFVSPSVYLKHNVKILSGNGDTEPYILK